MTRRAARRYPLEPIARDIGVEFKRDAFKWLDPDRPAVHTEGGEQFSERRLGDQRA